MYNRNVLQISFASVFIVAGTCLLLSEIYVGYDAAVAFYLSAPLMIVVGMRLAAMRVDALTRANSGTAYTTYDIELNARYAMHKILWGHPTIEIGVMGNHRIAVTDLESNGKDLVQRDLADDKLLLDSDAQDDSDMQTRAVRAILTPTDIAAVSAIYNKGCSLFRSSCMMQIIAARFFLTYSGNRHLHMT